MGVRGLWTGNRVQAGKGIGRLAGLDIDEHRANCIISYFKCYVLAGISFEGSCNLMKHNGLDGRDARDVIAGIGSGVKLVGVI
jgi:hypothetical protein